ncbi:MAG: hypothetical protein JXA41_07420 [Deltaproteobacteria bacterium]|nr:hypothetical protein [Deltaproteobacteria bacterium]
MINYSLVGKKEVLVIYDDEMTTPEIIINTLKSGNMPILGEPVFIK